MYPSTAHALLQAVHAGLLAGRQLIWDEAARRIGVLLSSPAAFEGEHFLQVGLCGGNGSLLLSSSRQTVCVPQRRCLLPT